MAARHRGINGLLVLPKKVRSLAAFEELNVPLEEEHLLIHSAKTGDRQASAVLVERYWDRLYRWLFHLTHNRHSAEDLAQETFLKAFANLSRFKTGTNFRAWLFRIAYNNFVNHWRAPNRTRQSFPSYLASREEGPAEKAVSQETLAMVSRAVGRLPADYRAAFLLRVEQGLSFQQIAEIVGIKEETARWRVFKARQKLMGVLAPQMAREEV